jgi:hypothetical protein
MTTKIFSIRKKRTQQRRNPLHVIFIGLSIFSILTQTSCKKMVTIDNPINSITTSQVFSTDALATASMAGIYTTMINGTSLLNNGVFSSFATGMTTLVTGYSSDELVPYGITNMYATNTLTSTNAVYGTVAWTSLYKTIYGTNAVIDGIAASTSGNLHQDIRTELTAEAKFVRAFSYSYLISFFGDVPLVLTVDFNQTARMARTPKAQVYQQVIQDLKDAQAALPADYTYGQGERIIPNKWAATALLARVYLYMGDYVNAAEQANAVIKNTAQFNLVTSLNGVFLKNSNETIWQLKQNTSIQSLGTATAEGYQFIPRPLPTTGLPSVYLSSQLLSSFEPGDQRRQSWVGTTTPPAGTVYYFPFKYKTGASNYLIGGTATEYYMVLRLAEQYLIRAEAEAKGANGGAPAAIADLNVIRHRAGLPDLSASLTSDQLWAAVSHERQIELFSEWGHRWFDLIRMGFAHNALSVIPGKQPWLGDYQLLYPIPAIEISYDHNLAQNPGY